MCIYIYIKLESRYLLSIINLSTILLLYKVFTVCIHSIHVYMYTLEVTIYSYNYSYNYTLLHVLFIIS